MIYLVRHGQTDWNLFKRFNGVTETFLNQTGIEQAKKQAEKLKNIEFDICFCSPQKRAVQTGKIIYEGKMVLDERLAEINCGEFEGAEENEESMKLFWQAIKTGDKGTESFNDFMKRHESFCNMIIEEYLQKNVLIITHAANARIINYYLSGRPEKYDFNKAVARNGEILTYQLERRQKK